MNLLWVAVVSALAACGGSQPPAPAPTVVGNEAPAPAEQAPATPAKRSVPTCENDETNCSLLAMRYFRDEMCDCASRADKDCAERVTDEMTTWAQEAPKRADAGPRWKDGELDEMETAGRQLGECTTRALMPASTSTAPPPSAPPGRQIPVGPPPGPKPSCGNTPSCAMDTVVWFADAMCACTTKQCAQDVTDEMTKWAQQQASTQTSSSARPSSADAKKMEAVGKRLGECTTDVMMNTP